MLRDGVWGMALRLLRDGLEWTTAAAAPDLQVAGEGTMEGDAVCAVAGGAEEMGRADCARNQRMWRGARDKRRSGAANKATGR